MDVFHFQTNALLDLPKQKKSGTPYQRRCPIDVPYIIPIYPNEQLHIVGEIPRIYPPSTIIFLDEVLFNPHFLFIFPSCLLLKYIRICLNPLFNPHFLDTFSGFSLHFQCSHSPVPPAPAGTSPRRMAATSSAAAMASRAKASACWAAFSAAKAWEAPRPGSWVQVDFFS